MLRYLRSLFRTLGLSQGRSTRPHGELELLYDKAPIGMCLVDRDMRYLRINQWLASINGVSCQEHLGKTLQEVLPSLAEVVLPYYERVFRTGEAIIDVEVCGTTSASAERRCWLVSYHPLKSDDGTVEAVSSIVQDVTIRTSYQHELENANQRIHAILESITDGFISFDAQWNWGATG